MNLDIIKARVEEDFSNYLTIKRSILNVCNTFDDIIFRYNFKLQPRYSTYNDQNGFKCALFEWDDFLRVNFMITETNKPFCNINCCGTIRRYNLLKKIKDVNELLYNLVKFYEVDF